MEGKKEIYISIRKKTWKDLEDNGYIYRNGDIYPREGLEVTKKRIKELSSTKNKIGEILIEKFEEENVDEKTDSENETEENTDELTESENEENKTDIEE